ncbi:p450 domain containing protein, partial [Asbolus verrucosus]
MALIIIVLIIILTICYTIRQNKKYSKLPPGSWNLPIVGHLRWLNPKAPYLSTSLSKKFVPIYGLYLGGIYTVVVFDVKLVKKLFSKDITSAFLIQAYIAAKNKNKDTKKVIFYSDQQFYHVLNYVFGAGLDGSLHTLIWYLLYTVLHQEVQILQGNLPSLNDVSLLPYLRASIAEAQRIRTTAPLGIPHAALGDTEIEGFKVPDGTMIIALQWAIHMDAEIWHQPEMFKPERFIDDEGHFHTPESFVPFLTGECFQNVEFRNLFLFLGERIGDEI